MDWKTVVGTAAPLLGTLLGGPATGLVVGKLASAFGVAPTESAVAAAIQADPEAAAKIAEIESNERVSLQRLATESETTRMMEVNKTYRAELASSDPFVRRMRPSFGYVVLFQIIVITLMAVFVVGFRPDGVDDFVSLVQALSWPMIAALSVLGVYVKQRSNEKAWSRGLEPKGLLGSLLK